jgi:2-polyprenyl-6-methoxyphenol hydroxylase-like FAD-dependent oxidoreductase
VERPFDSSVLVPTRGTLFDAAVLGAGPAGAAAALFLARAGHRVLVAEPRGVSAPPKPCGEGLMAGGVEVLRALGLEELLEAGLPFEQVSFVGRWGARLDLPLPSPGLAIERDALDRALRAALEAAPGITWFPGRLQARAQAGGGFLLRGGAAPLRARAVVLATGLAGTGLSELPSRGWARQRMGVRRHHLAGARPLTGVEVHSTAVGELYLTPLPQGRVNLAWLGPRACTRPDQQLEAALAAAPVVAAALGPALGCAGARRLGAAPRREVAGAGWFLAGDAAAGLDPLLGAGVTIALTTGQSAAHAVELAIGGRLEAARAGHTRRVRAEVRHRALLADGLLALGDHPVLREGALRVLRAVPPMRHALTRLAQGPGVLQGASS